MARDYASPRSKGQGRRKAPARKRHASPPGTPGWVWMLLGIGIGAVAAAAVWILRPADGTAPVAMAPQRSAAAPDSGPSLPPEEESRFSFYEMLPSYEVVIPRDEVAPKPKRERAKEQPQPLAEEGDFIIQVGSFRSRDEADAQRAQLALIGVEARIERVTIDASQTWYRVRVGPIADAAKVHSVMVRLQEHGLKDVMLMRVRG